jgi:Big-like domain-containing protein/centrosomal CEP192-like protein
MRAFTRRFAFLGIVMLAVVCSLSGYAPAQDEAYGVVVPTAVNFGPVLVGQTSPQQRVTLKNTGTSELTVSSISISGNFALPGNQCAAGVKPGTHCNVYVTYTPHALETDTGTLTFVDNASNTPQTVSLTGTGATTVLTKTTVTTSSKSIYAGQQVTFTATVTSLGGGVIPDGEQVYFSSSGGGLGYATLQAGVAILTTSNCRGTDQATQKVTAQYVGDQSFYPSQGSVDIFVFKYETTVTVTSDPNPSVYGQPVTFTASASCGCPETPGGRMILHFPKHSPSRGGSYTLRTLEDVGSYYVEGQYFGDAYTTPAWGSVVQVVTPTSTTIAIKSSKSPSKLGQSVTLLAIVQSPWPEVNVIYGSVTFTSGGNTLATVELKDSRGSLVISSLPAGQNTITVTYTPGNDNYLGSSGSVVQTVQ